VNSNQRELFADGSDHQMWLTGESDFPDSNVLVTVSSESGEETVLISDSQLTRSSAKLFVEAPPERVQSTSVHKYYQARKALKYAGYGLSVLLLCFSALSFSGISKARIVLTGSMAPVINAGDVIITTAPKYHSPKQGDIITYTARRFNGAAVAVISHRIIGGDPVKGFVVKGDRNKSPDVQRPKLSDVVGVVIFTVPFIGNLLTPKALFLIVPSLFGFWLILDAMKNAD
jgi:signal peptidase I